MNRTSYSLTSLLTLPVLALIAVALLAAPSAFAVSPSYYWDNLTGAGFGTAGGTWSSSGNAGIPGWSTDATAVADPSGSTITTATTDTSENFGGSATTNGLGAGTITVSGAVNSGPIVFGSQSGAITISGGTSITLPASATITVNNAQDTINTPLAGGSSYFQISGAGDLVLGGTNLFNNLQIGSGGANTKVSFNNTNNLGSGVIWLGAGTAYTGYLEYTNASGSATYSTPSVYIGGASTGVGGGGILNNDTVASHTLTFNNTAFNAVHGTGARTFVLGGLNTGANTISGAIINNGVGTLSLTKQNAGTWILSGTNTYTGATTVSAGTLLINSPGSLTNTSAVTVSAGATFGGTGTIQGAVTNNGYIAPGGVGAIGQLTLTNILADNYLLAFDLTSPVTAGTTYDQINGAGTLAVVLAGPTVIQLNPTTGVLTNGTYYLITNTATLNGGTFVLPNGATNQTISGVTLTLTNSQSGLILNVSGDLAYTNLTWVGTNTVWDSATSNWKNGSTAATYADGNVVTFDDTGTATVVGTNLSPAGVIFNNSSVGYTVGASGTPATIIGSGGVTKYGSVTVTFNGANNYTGNTIINAGTLAIGSSGTAVATLGNGTYSGNIYIASGAQLLFDNNANQTLSGIISGSGTLRKSGGSTLTLSGNNTYTGKTTISAISASGPVLSISSFNSVNGGTPLLASSSLGCPTTVANGTIDLGSGVNTRSCALIYTGPSEITDRVLNISFNSSSGHTLEADTTGGGLLKFTSAFTSGGSSSGSFTLQGSGNAEIVQGLPALGCSAGLKKAQAGTWTLDGNNLYTVPTTISAGELVGTTGGSISNNTITVSSGATNGVLLASANGQWTCGNLTYSSTTPYVDFNFGGLVPSTTTAPLRVNTNLTFTGTPTVILRNLGIVTNGVYPLISYGSIPSGTPPTAFISANVSGSISNNNADTLYLVVTNCYANNNGDPLLWAASGGNWTSTANWKNTNGTTGLTYYDPTAVIFDDTASVTLTNLVTNTVVVSPASVTANLTNRWYVISGSAIAGSGGLTKNGTNMLTLSGANTYTGATVVNGGAVALNNLNAIVNSSSISVSNGGTLQLGLAGTFAYTNAMSLVGAGGGVLGQYVGALHFVSGAIIWNAPLTLGGATTISGFGATVTPTLGGAIGGSGPLTILSRGGGATQTTVWTLNAASTYSGDTTIQNSDGLLDTTIKLGVANALPTTTSLNFRGTVAVATNVFSTFDLNGFNQTLAGLTDTNNNQNTASYTIGKRVINSSGTLATLTLNIVSGTNTYGTPGTRVLPGTIGGTTAGGVAANNLALTKTGAGTLTLAGTNTYTGATTVNAGTLALGVGSALSASTAVTLGAATLDVRTFANSVSTLDVTNAGTINLGSGGTLAFANSSAKTWGAGVGTLTITGAFVSGSSLRFGTTSGGLTSPQLNKISATGYSSFALDANGYLTAIAGGTPTITGATNFANPFITTNGTASAAQSFAVTGANLTTNITVTAAPGFEVSTNSGTAYGSTAIITNMSGSASGTVYIRLAATAPVGTYNSSNIVVLTSTGATSITNKSSASGNVVYAAVPGNFSGISVSGTGLTLNVTNGTPGGPWTLLESTNLLLPVVQWPTNRTGNYDGSGNLTTNILNVATNPAAFYLLK